MSRRHYIEAELAFDLGERMRGRHVRKAEHVPALFVDFQEIVLQFIPADDDFGPP